MNTEEQQEFLKWLADQKRLGTVGPGATKTFSMEILRLIMSGLGEPFAKDWTSNYFSSGLDASFIFADGKKYRLSIEEVRK